MPNATVATIKSISSFRNASWLRCRSSSGHARVIRPGAPAGVLQPLRQRIHFLARRAIDDAGLAAVPLEHVEDLRLHLRAREHAIHQVRPIERADQLLGVAQAELRDDVAPHARGRGRGVGVQADRRPALAQPRELAILGTEVVAPLADAVRLVDGDEADRARRQQIQEPIGAIADQPLGRDIQQLILALAHAARHFRLALRRHRAVVAGRRHAVADQRVDLVLHQRDQRRHHHRQAFAGDRRRLEAQRLAAAGRQHQQRVAAGQHRIHRLTLQRAEGVVAPVLFENGGQRDCGFQIEWISDYLTILDPKSARSRSESINGRRSGRDRPRCRSRP